MSTTSPRETGCGGVAAIGIGERSFKVGPVYFVLDTKLLTGRLEYSRRLSADMVFNAGLDMLSSLFDARFRGPGLPRPGEPPGQPFSTRAVEQLTVDGDFFYPAGYVKIELAPSARAKIVPGLRVDYQNVSEQLDVSPRVNGRHDIVHGFPRTTVKGGIGVFHQPPLVQEMSLPLGNPKLKSIRSLHYALGIEQEVSRHLEGSAEAFYKQLDNVVVGLAGATAINTDDQNVGTGRVFGGELLLKYKPDQRFFGWLAYTLSRSTRVEGRGEPERQQPEPGGHPGQLQRYGPSAYQRAPHLAEPRSPRGALRGALPERGRDRALTGTRPRRRAPGGPAQRCLYTRT